MRSTVTPTFSFGLKINGEMVVASILIQQVHHDFGGRLPEWHIVDGTDSV